MDHSNQITGSEANILKNKGTIVSTTSSESPMGLSYKFYTEQKKWKVDETFTMQDLTAEEDDNLQRRSGALTGGHMCFSCNQEMPASVEPICSVIKKFPQSDMAASGIELKCIAADRIMKSDSGVVLARKNDCCLRTSVFTTPT